jgi:deazaflavin-dependent oxidoreductase (nitroreductase family)
MLTTDVHNSTSGTPDAPGSRYVQPNGFTRRVFNPMVARLTRLGISVWGSRVLEVRGRRSGEWRSVPVNVLTVGDVRYLVAPRGTTEWVRNIRVAGGGRLRVGRRVEEIAVAELVDAAKPAIMRPYLQRWKWEVGQFFQGVGPDASDEELLAIADGYPVFRIVAAS